MRSPGTFQASNGALQLFTAGAAPKSLYSGVVQTAQAAIGTLACTAAVVAKTSTTTFTGTWQVSDDNSTFVDCVDPNNPASVAIATGTGSSVTTTKSIGAPIAVFGYKFARLKVTTAVSTADGTDDGVTFSLRYSKA
jgi:hypothetical protein